MLNSLTNEFETNLKALLPVDRFREADAQYLEEPRGRYTGQQSLVALPRSTDEVSSLVKACSITSESKRALPAIISANLLELLIVCPI